MTKLEKYAKLVPSLRTTHSDTPSLEELAVRLTDPVKPGPPDLIPGFLPKHGQLVVSGQTDVGKSLLSLECISSLVTGKPLWGALKPTTVVKKVLYVLGEHYNEVIQRLWDRTKLPMSDNVWLLGPEALSLDKYLVTQGKPNQAVVEKFKMWADRCDLIVFDPLTAFITGSGEAENDSVQMRLLLDLMGIVTQSSGASCLILAHHGKPMIDKFGDEHKRKSYATRGSSGIEDAATNIFYMESGPATNTFDLVCRKYKGDAPGIYRLLRDEKTLTHALISTEESINELQKREVQNKLDRIQSAKPDYSRNTCIELVAAFYGKPISTIKQWLAQPLER